MGFLIYGVGIAGYGSKPARLWNHCQGWPLIEPVEGKHPFLCGSEFSAYPRHFGLNKRKPFEWVQRCRQFGGRECGWEKQSMIMRWETELESQDPHYSFCLSGDAWQLRSSPSPHPHCRPRKTVSALEWGFGAGESLLGRGVDRNPFRRTGLPSKCFSLPWTAACPCPSVDLWCADLYCVHLNLSTSYSTVPASALVTPRPWFSLLWIFQPLYQRTPNSSPPC